ncbi:response regulator [Deminuibacter soli]|uniref:histidine kinase n=1 Tax=Deminuibacter soli TaxID=2291815 RepID=A0A3E1NIJ5_9BACT|nr:response regulator [Deminuibacter soli]RFM27750.1 response regulator [Deminuibacter soli]
MNTQASFKRNLIVGFGLSLLLLVVSSVASYMSISNLLDSTKWVNHTYKVIQGLDNVMSTLKDAETGQRGYLITGDDVFLEPYKGARERALGYLQDVHDLTLDNPAQTTSALQLKELISQRIEVLQKAIDLEKEKRTIDIQDLKKGKEYMDNARLIVEEMKSREQGLLTVRTNSMNRYAGYTPPLIVVAAILAILITIFFYARVQNDFDQRLRLQLELQAKDEDISRRIDIVHKIAGKIADGEYSTRVNDSGKDGLGSLAYSLNRMAGSLESSFNLLSENEWQQTGIATLNEIMIGEKSLELLTKDVITYLAEYTQCSAGVFYVMEEKELHFFSSYAFMPGTAKNIILPGEGLLGQSVESRHEIILTDIAPDAMQVQLATGVIKPSQIIAFPVFDGHTVKGAIELAAVKPFEARHIQFLKSAAHNIGVVVNRTQSRKKLQELLEETQSQAEELQSQHSELENLNTELELQAQKLQASDEELRVQQEELLQANQELEERSHQLEERNQLIVDRNREIQQQAEELALSTKYKSEFLANMSHELRTPLNSILLLSRLMSENKNNNLSGEQVEYAQVIQSSGKGLLSLIDEILDLSKIESGKMDLEYHQVALTALAANMNALFQPLATEKKLAFGINIAAGLPADIETDQLRLEQIVRNLLSNAFKFTSKGSVTMNIAAVPGTTDKISISVADTGIGIAPNKQQLIFEAFQQADGSTRRKYGGTGLGLSISRELAKLLGGEIRIESEQEKGSNFTVIIPVSQKAARESRSATVFAPLPSAEPEKTTAPVTEVKDRAKDPRYTTTIIPAAIPDDRDSIGGDDRVVLIIEDDTHFAKSILDYTHQQGYKGIVAVRGDEGVELARKFKPMGILLDIQLPVKNGWEVMEDLKNDPQTRPIPVHIMSSFEVKNESLQKGAVDFINKPVAFDKMQEIFNKIEYVLTHHPKKVLIVEENAKHAKALAYFLNTFDLNLEVKSNINEGVESLQKNEVDCVILDMGVPAQKGYETLDAVKKTAGLEHIPIIVFTGKSLSAAEELRIKKYADSIIIKTAHSYQRILDEVSLFLHLVEEKNNEQVVKKKYKNLGSINEVLQGRKILIADDDVRNIFSLTKTLESYKMNVLSAMDGKEALKLLNENPDTDIVLMDMMMPEMDGYETTRRIRFEYKWKNLPVIAVTAKAMTGDREKCINAGASDYITKPVDIDQLLSLLRVWLYERA